MSVKTTLTHRGRRVTASYQGGPYIDLAFGPYRQPSEVINVWDYEAGGPVIPETREGVREAVLDWIVANDQEWPEWYEGYLENARW